MLYPRPSPEVATRSGEASPGWVTVRENGLSYSFDITRVMFSSGNVSEKARVAKLPCSGEVVVDLYAGIGYYVLPYLVHAGARLVYACEWNEHSLQALEYNLSVNRLGDGRCVILRGDNRITTANLDPGIADRVNLGLLPSSEEGWPIAVRLLNEQGGWLHVHANLVESGVPQWVERVEQTVADLAGGCGKRWIVCCRHLEKVKSYAPHVWHVVADLECRVDSRPERKKP